MKKSAVADPIMTRDEVATELRIHSSTLDRMVRQGLFPPPIRMSARRIGWRRSVVMEHCVEDYPPLPADLKERFEPNKPVLWGVIRYSPVPSGSLHNDPCAFDGWYSNRLHAVEVAQKWRKDFYGWFVIVVRGDD